jgi:hypothetical protein
VSYGYHAVNMVASVRANSDVFDRLVVYDLGLTEHHRRLLAALGAEVRGVPAFSPHWGACFTWKPWIWTQLDGDAVFYLDAGASVLRSLEPALEAIERRGSFLVSQGNELRDIVPPDYFDRYGLDPSLASRPYAAAGILGFRPGGDFYRGVLEPTYRDCLAGLNLGFSPGEEGRNRGPQTLVDPPVRDCPHFRWDQTVLNVHLALVRPEEELADLDEYAGWRSPRDHPRQVIWSHRRRGDLRYLQRAPYGWRNRLFGLRFRLRWRWKLRPIVLRRETWVLKARAVARSWSRRLRR